MATRMPDTNSIVAVGRLHQLAGYWISSPILSRDAKNVAHAMI
jgi:hypothetical protein